MSAKAISEQTGKEFLYKYICTSSAIQNRFKYARVTPVTDWARLTQDHPWLLSEVRRVTCFSVVAEPLTDLCPPRLLPVGHGMSCCGRLWAELCSGSFLKDRSLLLLCNIHLQHWWRNKPCFKAVVSPSRGADYKTPLRAVKYMSRDICKQEAANNHTEGKRG